MNNTWMVLIVLVVEAVLASSQCDASTPYVGVELGSDGKSYNKYYCIKCEQPVNKKTPTCTRCKYGETTASDGCNVHKTSEEYRAKSRLVGNIENCEGAMEDQNLKQYSCFMCSEGYALVKGSLGLYTCDSSNISRCIVSEKENNQEKCMVCRNSVPSASFTKCEDKGPYSLDGNCEFVMRHPVFSNKSATCVLCYNGYALVPVLQTNGTTKWECTPTSSTEKASCPIGCAKCDIKKKCLWCSHYHGYYMTSPGVCSYFSQLLRVSLVVLAVLATFM